MAVHLSPVALPRKNVSTSDSGGAVILPRDWLLSAWRCLVPVG